MAGYYNRPNQEGLYHHFKAVHDATAKPIIVYNIPPRAIGYDVQPATLARLAELPRIAGVKDATGDLARPWTERQLIKSPSPGSPVKMPRPWPTTSAVVRAVSR